MPIKKFPIITAWHVNIYCDKCGEVMEYVKFDFDPDKDKCRHVYKCKCGHEQKSKKLYPNQVFNFDTSNPEEIEDAE